ncbi:SDR family NAD(P)-dependent oxidoreductase [Geodermatophilus sp. DSM 44513]|uniref:SDR family NAD(P)-dependent oxidoreductase n=1 Tax=Geodermatophilus sp. DSM 44513 TaxID=1528104 RepID=UPI00126E5D4F|nr:SDR family NAD(P)-dependent oxidoreductase [Geodermatophilus sp. DSM 44513]WNV74157.1 SDR family NAD(P)-dependent oxidoreductase [Geodermatophilus sp. DSM 44513]
MTGRLAGRVAVVTGAGSVGPGWGNGRAAAVRFAEEGARVLAVDLREEALAETLAAVAERGGTARPHVCDVTDADAVAAMVRACVEELGTPDVLLNNVGGSRHGGAAEMTEQLWHEQLDANLTSTFLTCRAVLPLMVQAGRGAVVNTSSTSGIRWTGAAQVAYSAAKAGVIAFTRAVAVQHAPDGIRANTVVPGQLHTPMVEARLAGQRAGGDVEALLAQRQARIPLRVSGDGRDTAAAALFLASDEARFITGTELVVDGGMSARCD